MVPVTLEVEAGPALEPSSLRLANTARPHLKKIKQDIQLLIKSKTVIPRGQQGSDYNTMWEKLCE